jgi:hypothetical protein
MTSILYGLFLNKLLAAAEEVRQCVLFQISDGTFNNDLAEAKLLSLKIWRYCQIDSCQRVTFKR